MKLQAQDLTYVHIQFEIEILEDKISLIQEQFDKEVIKSSGLLKEKSKGLNPDDLIDEHVLIELNQIHRSEIKDTLPRLIINPFILTLWSFFESTLIEMSTLCQKKTTSPLGIEDIKGNSIIDRVKKYFRHVLDSPIEILEKNQTELELVYAFRNILAHNNGKLDTLRRSVKNNLTSISYVSTDWQEEYIVFEIDYLKSSKTLIEKVINEIICIHKNLK